MKKQISAFSVILLITTILTIIAVRTLSMKNFDSELIREALIESSDVVRIDEFRNGPVVNLPLLVSIRFHESKQQGGIGFPDRQDVYTVESTTGTFVCRAHVRSNKVCYVEFEGEGDPEQLRIMLRNKFPGLKVD
jgi:hypothetical protein